jgi:hypothetical protein
MYSARNRTGAAALAGAAITGLIAFALFLAGGLLLWANGHYKDSDGYFSTASEQFRSPTYAITSDELQIGGHGAERLLSSDHYGTIRLTADARGDKPVFIGIAPTRDVNAYLREVAHSRVADVDYAPFSARYTQRDGTRHPAAPATQKIWTAEAHGAGQQTLRWDVESGDWSVVVMNEDGSRGVLAGVSAGAKVPYISEFGFAALGFGLLFIAATAGLMLYGTRPPTRRLAFA